MNLRDTLRVGMGVLLAAGLATTAHAQQQRGRPADRAAVDRLAVETAAAPAINDATGTVRFVRLNKERASSPERRPQGARGLAEKQQRAAAFLRRHQRAFGFGNRGEELVLLSANIDTFGHGHLAYRQQYGGVPVFGALMRVHFDAADDLASVNGTLVPDIDVNTTPSRSPEDARRTAFTLVKMQTSDDDLLAAAPRLLIFREGLAQGIPGANHLAWEVEVGNGTDVREFVYLDAHSGKLVDQITGIHDGLNRRAFNAQGATAPGPNYPSNPFWVEGDFFPTTSTEANNMLDASKDIYGVFRQAFGRDSFDAGGATMDSIFNRGNGCPNASWNGVFISFCPGTTSDDVTAHEWGHAYTEYTHNLIYQWQPGALNESYSDIWGETVDLLNGRGTDLPDGLRTPNACTAFTPARPNLRVNSPASIAGTYAAGSAAFGPRVTSTGLTGDLVLADDGVTGAGTVSDGCCAGPSFVCAANSWTNAAAVAGKIAVVDRGVCGFAIKAKNAQLNGAVGVVVANNVAGVSNMAGADATITIPSLLVSLATGNLIKGELAGGVNATLLSGTGALDNSYRWLMGEDATAFGGAIRDMWNPTCYANPGKVTDTDYYVCSTADGGGVHTNSGIPNHAYALLVDGGTYNGQTVGAIGVTKAAHIYYRAQSVYQTPSSDFADHADAIESSCTDLVGASLNDLLTGAPSGQVITAGDCVQVAAAAAAVQLRTPPAFCNFQPLLGQNPSDRCDPATTTQVNLFTDGFEGGAATWGVSHVGVRPEFTPRDWVLTNDLPDRAGSGFFAVDPLYGTCAPGGDESGVLYLESPPIAVPASVTSPLLTFDHWVGTEAGWDGGNLQISVNGGAFTMVPQANFTYNAYNRALQTVAAGNSNPLAGQRAFSGTDGGSVGGTWGRSHVNLAGLAAAGSSVRLRWALGTDGCGGAFGWYVDDVTAYTCTSNALPTISVDDVTVTEGNTGFTSAAFTVSLSHPYAQPVTVRYRLADGTAKRGNDYVPFDELMERTIVIPPLATSATVALRIKGDKQKELDETFSITLRSPINGTIGKGTGICTIVNDDQ